jgi:hypothetical protein
MTTSPPPPDNTKKKKSTTTRRPTTLEARYDQQIKKTKKNEQQQIEYILDTIPYIREYTGMEEEHEEEEQEECVARSMPKKYKVRNKSIKVKDTGNKSLDAYVEVTGRHNKEDVLNRYMLYVEKDSKAYNPHAWPETTISKTKQNTCQDCHAPLVINTRESTAICTQCGLMTPYLGHNLSYNEEIGMQSVSSFSYKRSSHFQEYLSSIQCKEGAEIPQEVLDAVASEMKKNRIKTITPGKVRTFLKKLKMSHLYDHSNAICMKLLGKTPPRFSPELEQQLKQMFYQVQQPFENAIKDTKRKNFLSYSYCLYKFFQLLGHDELLQYCSLLKDRHKLYVQDQIWKKITDQLKWEFIPSV